MECHDIREIADSFLAEELLTETNHEILRHLETCRGCRADLAARRALREGIRRAFGNASSLDPRPEFIAQLRASLQNEARHLPVRRGMRFRGWWALAATVLLAVVLGLGYLGRDWIAAGTALARAAVGDHLNCALHFRLAERPIELGEAARRYGAVYRALENLPPNDVTTAVGVAHVLERHACVYDGRRFAHIVFEYRGERVSLLVTDAEESVPIALPREEMPHVTEASRISDMSVVSFRASSHMVFVVGDVPQPDLNQLADSVAAPLYRALVGA